MTLFSDSSVQQVNVPAETGGCGRIHYRPEVNGAPQHPWLLTCEPCEDHLRKTGDVHWAGTLSEIPETYDEKLAREDFEKRGAKDKDAVLTLALAKLAGLDASQLPASLTRMISGQPAHVPGMLECPRGHAQPSGLKFCGECGTSMSGPVPAAALNGPDSPAAAPARPVRLRDQNKATLQALCAARGLDASGSNADLVTRLSSAGVTNNDLAAFLAA